MLEIMSLYVVMRSLIENSPNKMYQKKKRKENNPMSLWFLINIAQLCFSKKKMLNYVVYTYGAHLLHHYLFIFPDRQGRASSATSIVVWKPNIQGQVQSFSCFLKILDRNSLLVCSFGDKYLLAIDLNLKTNLLFSVLIYLWRWFSLLLLMVAKFFFNPTIGKDGNHLNGAH